MELVVTLAIIGLLAGVAGPRFFNAASFDERVSRDQLAASLRHAQKLAAATGCATELQISGASWTVRQRASCDTGAFSRDVVHPGTGAPVFSGSAAGAVTVTSSANPIRFDSRGRSVNGAGMLQEITLTLGPHTVQVVGATGYVHFP